MALEPGLEAAFRYTVRVVLERVEGRRLQFAIRLADCDRPVAQALVTRVVVDAATFLRDAGAGPTTT